MSLPPNEARFSLHEQFECAILIGHAHITHPLAPNQTIQLKATLTIPKSIKPGTYNLIAAAGPGPRKQMTVFATQQNALTI